MQYSLSNLNAFLLLLAIGYTMTSYDVTPHANAFSLSNAVSTNTVSAIASNTETNEELSDKANSPVQLIKQLKGYSSVNPMLAVSLIITLFSFIGVPPLLGFFAKQMVLSAALDKGYFFVVLIAILTSVISAVYYLSVVKNIFFDAAIPKTLEHATPSTHGNSSTSKDFLTHFFFIISMKHTNVYFGDFPIYEVDSDIRNAYTRSVTSFNIDDIILTEANKHKFDNEFAKDYKFSAYSIHYKTQLIGPLNIIISFLSLLILLFMFTPVE
jgi:NADH:ubiquinone oxidoreductase subunit 5 (subunit L)/multisubunit Na+/H+ antiporter MnhA subunit